MTNIKTTLHLDPTVLAALDAYQHRHRRTLPTRSAATSLLLRRALLAAIDPDADGLLAPEVARQVEAAAERVVREEVATLLRAQTDRLAGLLVKSGKDARSACGIGAAILEQVTGDRALARRLTDEARLASGPAYTARGMRAGGEG